MWQDAHRVQVQLVAHFDVLAEHGDILEATPAADCRLPADNGRLHPRVRLDLAIGHHRRALCDWLANENNENKTHLDANAILNDDTGSEDDIWSDSAALANLHTWIGQDIALDAFAAQKLGW